MAKRPPLRKFKRTRFSDTKVTSSPLRAAPAGLLQEQLRQSILSDQASALHPDKLRRQRTGNDGAMWARASR